MSDQAEVTNATLQEQSAYVAYAYSPRENSGSGGKYHLVAKVVLSAGRLQRQPGTPLCGKRFWGLDGGGRTFERFLSYPCPKCLANALKLAVVSNA